MIPDLLVVLLVWGLLFVASKACPMSRPAIDRDAWTSSGAVVFVDCPGCAVRLRLVDPTVSATGDVDPSLDCPACEYHEWVRLEGWDDGVH